MKLKYTKIRISKELIKWAKAYTDQRKKDGIEDLTPDRLVEIAVITYLQEHYQPEAKIA